MATGLRRTYPNLMTREGARGTEYEAWSKGNPPEHYGDFTFHPMPGGSFGLYTGDLRHPHQGQTRKTGCIPRLQNN